MLDPLRKRGELIACARRFSRRAASRCRFSFRVGRVRPSLDAPGDGDEGGEALRPSRCQRVRAACSHRKPGQVDSRRIYLELADRLVELGHGHVLHGHVGPSSAWLRLGKDHQYGVSRALGANGCRAPPGCLEHAVSPLRTVAVEIQDDRPLRAGRVLGRHVNLVAVGVPGHLDGPVEEARLDPRLGLTAGRDGQRQRQRCGGNLHRDLPSRCDGAFWISDRFVRNFILRSEALESRF